MKISSLGEFGLIKHLTEKITLRNSSSVKGIGDDCAVINNFIGIVIMLALAYLGTTELLTPARVLLYQIFWLIPGLLATEWTRVV